MKLSKLGRFGSQKSGQIGITTLQFPNGQMHNLGLPDCGSVLTQIVSKQYPVRNEKKSLAEEKFSYSYLDFKRPPFSNHLSCNAEILRQNGIHTAGHTQTAGRTAATAGNSKFSK
jgi:hypothetical protein